MTTSRFLVSIAVTLLALGGASPIRAQSNEDEAIKKVQRDEATTFWARDADAWQATWLHDAKATRTLISSGSYSSRIGWENFGPRIVEAIKQNRTPTNITPHWDNYLVQTSGDMAWIQYDQRATMGSDTVPQISREHRVLVKRDGQWKILSQITENVSSFGSTPTAIEDQLNTAGYNLLGTKKVNDAVEVFKLNVRLFPNSWNAYDSLGEAYAAAGDTKLAIENYEKSLALNPTSETGKEALAKLRATKSP